MSLYHITIKGISAELVLGNYMPGDPTIMNNWEEFYRYDDLLHESCLLSDHISEITVETEGQQIFSGKSTLIPRIQQKSYSPAFVSGNIYLRAECAEQAVYTASVETESFEINQLSFLVQDFDLLFKVGKSFVSGLKYKDRTLELQWQNATPVGNICLLCGFENGFLVPYFDAIKKIYPPK